MTELSEQELAQLRDILPEGFWTLGRTAFYDIPPGGQIRCHPTSGISAPLDSWVRVETRDGTDFSIRGYSMVTPLSVVAVNAPQGATLVWEILS